MYNPVNQDCAASRAPFTWELNMALTTTSNPGLRWANAVALGATSLIAPVINFVGQQNTAPTHLLWFQIPRMSVRARCMTQGRRGW